MYLPVAEATVITFLAPPLTCWACSVLLREPFTRMEQMSAIVSLLGVVLIARPPFLFSPQHTGPELQRAAVDAASALGNGTVGIITQIADRNLTQAINPVNRTIGVGIALMSMLGTARRTTPPHSKRLTVHLGIVVQFTTVRWIGERAHTLILVNYVAFFSAILSAFSIAARPDLGFTFPSTLRVWCYLAVITTSGFLMVSSYAWSRLRYVPFLSGFLQRC